MSAERAETLVDEIGRCVREALADPAGAPGLARPLWRAHTDIEAGLPGKEKEARARSARVAQLARAASGLAAASCRTDDPELREAIAVTLAVVCHAVIEELDEPGETAEEPRDLPGYLERLDPQGISRDTAATFFRERRTVADVGGPKGAEDDIRAVIDEVESAAYRVHGVVGRALYRTGNPLGRYLQEVLTGTFMTLYWAARGAEWEMRKRRDPARALRKLAEFDTAARRMRHLVEGVVRLGIV